MRNFGPMEVLQLLPNAVYHLLHQQQFGSHIQRPHLSHPHPMQKLHFASPSTWPVRPLPKALKWKGTPKFWKKRGVSQKKKKNGS